MSAFRYGIVFTAFLSLLAGKSLADDNLWIGAKAGTLGLGLEATWRPLPYLDLRVGFNKYDYDMSGLQAGLNYVAELGLDNAYGTANFRVPLNPMRFTVGFFSNGNEIALLNQGTSGTIVVGGVPLPASEVGTLRSAITFESTAPYAGIGFDFRAFGKASINLDLGVLWQDTPIVGLTADGPIATDPVLSGPFLLALEVERQELQAEFDNFKVYPVASIGLSFNF
ncbi:MAG: hypothetical protein ACE5FV_08330 [Woeseia sp.]